MKKIFPVLISAAIFIFLLPFAACKKHSSGEVVDPGNPNNKVKATVTFTNGIPFTIDASGSRTLFRKIVTPDGDTAISISGNNDYSQYIILVLYNFNDTGTHHYIPIPPPGTRESSLCTYRRYPLEVETNYEGDSAGTIIIKVLTATHIEGSFTATMSYQGMPTLVVSEGTFQGDY